MIYPNKNPQLFHGKQPQETDVLIIGGGIIGVCTAYYLAKKGVKVTLCEKGRVAGEQSSRNWGWIRQQGRDEPEIPLSIESRRLWAELCAQTGEDLGYQTTGVYYLAEKQSDLEGFENFVDLARQYELGTCMISRDKVYEAIQGKAGRWIGAMHTASDGRIEPGQATLGIAKAAERLGAVICENNAVRTLVKSGGEVVGAVTEQGEITAGQIVLAGGAWSSLFASNAGIKLPQLSVELTVAATQAVPDVFPAIASDNTFALRRRQDGGYTIALKNNQTHHIGPDSFKFLRQWLPNMVENMKGTHIKPWAPNHYPDQWTQKRRWNGEEISPFEKMRVLNSKPNQRELVALADAFTDRFPQLKGTKLKNAWGGMIDAMPDFMPVIDKAPQQEKLHIVTGFSGHGFGIGPSVGRLMADVLTGQPSGHDLSSFAFGRF
ncbi:4-methylaminobutanoate oxidase (formaldehyde-forming) [Pseudovibrio axinellae]|uniref:4-methylaminobutanoate oxidase (Formaldehyde-forming) n=1 Tax=Pseudovibrio axinellae TaxID=989403 RepID=A0A166AG19_9HYPH|nr:FAD-binding oxidoreductase [Pseudovibrio axinellae]KZL21021.1 4-methylaminobutanoate oxidase (formaldehyde-forming) [Pseudovibrio axinellae]SEP78644.1 Glycine/D-amino acid oxidase [Pseudovibrio axinellae]